MSIKWRPNTDGTKTAYLDITVPGCARLRESIGIRSDEPDGRRRAREYHDRIRADLWRQAKLGEKPRRTWPEAVVKWVSEHQHKRSLHLDQQYLRWLDPHLRDHFLDELDREEIERIMLIKEAEGVAPATVNRYAAIVRSILNAAAFEWGWLTMAPRTRMRPEDNDRITWMTQDEAYNILMPQLAPTAPHLYDAAEFTLHTGLRDANGCGLRWDQISADGKAMMIYRTKNGRTLATPLNSIAQAVLERRRGIHTTYVFSWRGKPVTRFNNSAYQKAVRRSLKAIGHPVPDRLDGFNWHSLRHTWASWAVQSGVSIERLQKLGGWETLDMAMRYAHLATAHLEPDSELVAQSIRGLRVVK